jgi:flagellar basal body-associated protein FliL
MSQAPKKPSKAKGCLALILMVVIVVIVVAIVAAAGGGGAKYSASFQAGGINPVSAMQDMVYITVKNTGKKAGTPTCTIELNTPSGDHGVDALTPAKAIAAGAQESYSDTITVTGNAAQSVTEALSKVTCS